MSSSCMQSCGPVVFLFVKHIRFSPHCTLIELLSDKRAPICDSRACPPPPADIPPALHGGRSAG